MHNQRAMDAVGRIERAIAHLEQGLADHDAASAAAEELERVRAAHRLLRARVEGAIGEIDKLLDGGKGAS